MQRSFDELGTPLCDVTFVVVDLETTGGSPETCAITEVGAVKYRGGECLGTLQTLVNPGVPIPPMITVLTGITESMVFPAPPIAEVLPPLLEFFGGAVLVGHNLRFDTSFLDAALVRNGYDRLAHTRVDTLGLARRLLRDEVPNLKLATLARHVRTSVEPSHRALDDARATAELLHSLLERAGSLGVLGLDDLLELPTIRAHPSVSKLRLTSSLPRKPGVYLFRDRNGRVLYVGKATNLRARVRSYFSSDDRRKVPQLLRETVAIDHLVCRDPLEAEVRELRMIHELAPRFNRRSKNAGRSAAYVKLTLSERFPRLAVVRDARDDGALYLGPLPSSSTAHAVKEAIESAVPVRRCPKRIGRTAPCAAGTPCVPAQLGVALCPCSGFTDSASYDAVVAVVADALRGDPTPLLEPLEGRMHALAADERFEEAALARDRLDVLTRTLERQRMLEQLVAAARVELLGPDGPMTIRSGRLDLGTLDLGTLDLGMPDLGTSDGPGSTRIDRNTAEELLIVARWLRRHAHRVRVVSVDGTLASRLPRLARYDSRDGSRRDNHQRPPSSTPWTSVAVSNDHTTTSTASRP